MVTCTPKSTKQRAPSASELAYLKANLCLNTIDVLSWKSSRGPNRKAWAPAGHVSRKGYVQVRAMGRLYYAHRIVWMLVHGCWPTSEIDHIDGNPRNNKPENLRRASRSQNQANTGVTCRSTSGLKGAYWAKHVGRWKSQIRYDGRTVHIGYFDTPGQAAEAYARKAAEVYGEYARGG